MTALNSTFAVIHYYSYLSRFGVRIQSTLRASLRRVVIMLSTEGVKISEIPEGHIYVCLECGRCSCDLAGRQALTPGWSQNCVKKAVRLSPKDLHIASDGYVKSVSRRAISKLRSSQLH